MSAPLLAVRALAVTGLFFCAANARAETPAQIHAPHRLRFDLGVGSAVGFAGGTYTWSPESAAHLEIGAGLGRSGLIGSVMPKVSFGSSRDRFVVGFGGAFAYRPMGASFWLNADLAGYEHLAKSRLLLSAAVGLTYMLGTSGALFPQARIGIGGWFGSRPASPATEPLPAGTPVAATSIKSGEQGSTQPDAGSASALGKPPPLVAPAAQPASATAAQATGLPSTEEPSRAPSSNPSRRHRLGLDLGLFSAVGFAGATYAYLRDSMTLEAAAGFGLSGVQLSLMPKTRLGSEGLYYVLGIGLSYADSRPIHGGDEASVWLNADLLGFERELSSGFSLSGALGLTVHLWRNSAEDNLGLGLCLPQLRVGVGYWF